MLHSVPVNSAPPAGLSDGRPFDPLAFPVDVLDVQDLILLCRRGSLRPEIVDVGEVRIGVQNSQSLMHFRNGHLFGSSPLRARCANRASRGNVHLPQHRHDSSLTPGPPPDVLSPGGERQFLAPYARPRSNLDTSEAFTPDR
jgi:hypothetical protein